MKFIWGICMSHAISIGLLIDSSRPIKFFLRKNIETNKGEILETFINRLSTYSCQYLVSMRTLQLYRLVALNRTSFRLNEITRLLDFRKNAWKFFPHRICCFVYGYNTLFSVYLTRKLYARIIDKLGFETNRKVYM